MLQSPGVEIPFTNGYYRSGRSLQFSAQRCVNYYPSIAKRPALSPSNAYMTPGIREVVSDTAGVSRGRAKFDGKAFFVNGNKLYRVDQNIAPDLTETYNAVELGDIGGSGRVIMVPGQLQLVIIVPDQVAYSWDGSTLTALDGLPNFRSPVRDVIHINSLFVFLHSDSNIIFHSNINDANTYNALDFTTVFQITEGVGLLDYRNQLFVMSDNLTIPYNYIGGSEFAFIAQASAEIPIGLRSVFAKTDIRQSYIFLGGGNNEEPGVWIFPQLVKISDETIDYEIQNLTDFDISTAFIEKHAQNDSEAVALVAGDNCFVYDLKTDAWHERRSIDDEIDHRWRVNTILQCYNRILVGDFLSNSIGILDDQEFAEYGNQLRRIITLQPIDQKGKSVKVKSVLVYMDAGFDGHLTMDYSLDGGYNWEVSQTLSAGDIGEYGRVLEFGPISSADAFLVLRFITDTTAKCNINKVLIK